MLVLAIDTATALTTVAVSREHGEVLAAAEHLDPRRHAEVLPRLVRQVLDHSGVTPTDLDVIAAGVGPGPFTGLRVGVAFARATAHALGIPVVGAMTLDAIARGHRASADDGLTVVTRSRRVEVAWATYDADARRLDGPLILSDADYPRLGRTIGDVEGVDELAYPSAAVLADLVCARLLAGEQPPDDRSWPEDASQGSGSPTALLLADLAKADRWLLPALPLYLRRPDAVPA